MSTYNDSEQYSKLYSKNVFNAENNLLGRFIKKEIIKKARGITILDLGCGDGQLLELLGEEYCKKMGIKYIGVDPSSELIGKAKKIYSNSDYAQFIITDAISFFDKNKLKFDYIISTFGPISYIPNNKINLLSRSMSDSLSNQGKLVLMPYSKRTLKGILTFGTTATEEGVEKTSFKADHFIGEFKLKTKPFDYMGTILAYFARNIISISVYEKIINYADKLLSKILPASFARNIILYGSKN